MACRWRPGGEKRRAHKRANGLRRIEENLPADAPEGDVFAHTAALLTRVVESFDPSCAVDTVTVATGPMPDGHVTTIWHTTLSLHENPDAIWRTRRGRRLLDGDRPEDVRQLLVDQADRLVIVRHSLQWKAPSYRAEWPVGLPATTWSEETQITGDYVPGTGYGPALALTATPTGWRVDPIPAPPDLFGFDGHFTWGTEEPQVLYRALVRVALNDPIGPNPDFRPPPDSELWQALRRRGPLRIAWTDLLKWARHDTKQGNNRDLS